ncbi:MAG: tetratricopeptide repeat protein [Bryobacteraceae bacterium]
MLPASLVLTLAFPHAWAAETGQLDGSPSLFAVLAAINAAGYDADLDSPANHPLREAMRKEIAAKRPAVLNELKRFFADRRQKTWAQELSQYVSFALSVGDPPNFEFRFRAVDLPPDVAPLQDFQPLLKKFYQQAGIDELWKKSQPAYDAAIARYHEPVSQAVLEVNAYLRNATSGYLGHRFQIYVDLLGAPNQIHTRSYQDDSFIVVTPSPEPQTNDVRHAYLHYLLDPTVIKYGDLLMKNKALLDYAQGAPALPEQFKGDFMLLATESVIKAVESRMARSNRPELVNTALEEGYVLTPHFAEKLPVYEKQEQAMRFYFPELVLAINLKREEQRLEKVSFAAAARVRQAKTAPVAPKPEPAGVYKTLEEAERVYGNRDWEQARKLFGRALQETDEKPLHAHAYYGLARIAVLEKNPEMGERLLKKTLELEPEGLIRGWTLVYLARLADASGERAEAVKFYKEALGVEGASDKAREAAKKGIEQSFARPD